MTAIGIVNFGGGGNLGSLLRTFQRLGMDATLVDGPDGIDAATRLVLPGVGHFDQCMSALNASGLRGHLDAVVTAGKPILGVCVGYQMMARRSEEGSEAGLGWLPADVVRFPSSANGQPLRVPHVGWNHVRFVAGPMAEGAPPRFYFTHSYYVLLDDPSLVAGTCAYGIEFAAAAARGSVYGVQFHPEKSHDAGLELVRSFATGQLC